MARVDSQGNPTGGRGTRTATSIPSGSGGGGTPVGTQEIRSAGYGYVQVFEWTGSRWEPVGPPFPDRSPEPDSGSGSSGPGPLPYGSTETGFLQSLDLENRQLNESIRSSQQRLDEIRLQEEAAGGRLNTQLAAERDRLNEQLAVTREQLSENKRQFDQELSYKREYDDRSLGLSERDVALRELTGERNYGLSQREQDLAELTGERSYEVSLANLDLQGQSLAINARKNELDHEVDLGRLSVEQARVQLEGEIAQGQLQLGRERLAVEREGLALQGELGRGDLALREKLGLGELDVSRGRLGLDTELGRGELAVKRQAEARQLAATYSDQFGKDPVRQALFSLGLKGGMSPAEAAFKSLGLATGGGGGIRPIAEQQAAAPPATDAGGQRGILVGEAGPEVVTQTPEGTTQVIPIRGAAAGGGNFNIRPTDFGPAPTNYDTRPASTPTPVMEVGTRSTQTPAPAPVTRPYSGDAGVPDIPPPAPDIPQIGQAIPAPAPAPVVREALLAQPVANDYGRPITTGDARIQQPAPVEAAPQVDQYGRPLGLNNISIVGRAATGGNFNIKPSYSRTRDPLRARREARAAANPAPAPTPTQPAQTPTPTPPAGGGGSSPYGPLYQPTYEPDNSGWDAIMRNIQENADTTARTTADTLGRALGVQGVTIDKNKGVLGLPTAQKAARAYLEAGIPVQNLITSGYSVGGEYGGTPAEEFLRQIMDVTPRGALQY